MKKRERVRNVEETDITSPNQFRRDESRELHRPSFRSEDHKRSTLVSLRNQSFVNWHHPAIEEMERRGKPTVFDISLRLIGRRGQTLNPEKVRHDERQYRRRRRLSTERSGHSEEHQTEIWTERRKDSLWKA